MPRSRSIRYQHPPRADALDKPPRIRTSRPRRLPLLLVLWTTIRCGRLIAPSSAVRVSCPINTNDYAGFRFELLTRCAYHKLGADAEVKPFTYVLTPKVGSSTLRAMMAPYAFEHTCNPNLFSPENFTVLFVREPMERFLSAYHELRSRADMREREPIEKGKFQTKYPHLTYKQAGISLHGTSLDDREKALLNMLIDDLDENGGRDTHLALQAEHLMYAFAKDHRHPLLQNKKDVDFVGRFENFDTETKRMARLLGIHVASSVAHANPRRDRRRFPSDVPSMLRFLISTDRLRKLCQYLLPDYECFNYTLPAHCRLVLRHANVK